MGDKIVTPISVNQGLHCTLTPPWFVQHSEYHPLNGNFEFLINGEQAFGAVHRAIEQARHSVCIICWGFQPSMHFIRDGRSPAIGALLAQKAAAGIKVRVLCYSVGPYYVSGTGAAVDEPNMPNRSGPYRPSAMDVPPTSTQAQNDYDSQWFSRYDRDRGLVQAGVKRVQDLLDDTTVRNLHFRSRGFTLSERNQLLNQDYEDRNISGGMRRTLAASPSHHQKMVLVDYESPADHIGFVMGHNMLDEYWDTSDHSCVQRSARTGRNGKLPRQDLSSRITGQLCGDLVRNFRQAWKHDTGEVLPEPPAYYPLRDTLGQRIQGQVLRTQPQYRVEDIKKAYLQAVNNATQCIYIENQYFRWPPLADKIRNAATKQCQWGRDPARHRSLYLFVVTNSSNAGLGKGTVKTHEMLDSLGRADAMPGVELQQRIDDQRLAIAQLDQRLDLASRNLARIDRTLPNPAVFKDGQYPSAYTQNPKTRADLERYNALIKQRVELQRRRDELQRQRDELERLAKQAEQGQGPGLPQTDLIAPEPRPGLKVHVCTLVPPDTPAGRIWNEVYVHAKLMIVNDTFMTLGSTNINSRSMEVDSELNIAHCNPHISKQARLDLWRIHTKGIGAQEDVADAFQMWGELIKINKEREAKTRTPQASLRGFMRIDPTLSDSD
ncbi:hypothetical protein N8I74_04810 [Chitiniphilus purpureus]|uniref:PLD phosphodiesterase domain-containing protein n=1 Tax=Chitiniphilus purpureus TaxID=2981137 RepID=A0ABY6DRK7_9NEIS|nr:phospholipase D-like domain-containing protein [Chitiniphilus sp. CD1]UXY16343.1 hypothetical protein N8I74_04810 [Chitiniphilus sp. CD1]